MTSPSSSPPDSFPEKRTFRRYALWFPVTLVPSSEDLGRAEVWAICRDASAGGMLVSSATLVTVGTKVSARFRVAQHEKERVVDALVIRSESNDGELMLAFPFRIGLRFTTPILDLPDELAHQPGGEER